MSKSARKYPNFKDITEYGTICKTEPVSEGASPDKKYFVYTAEGNEYFLRISPMRSYKQKKRQFEILKILEEAGVPMPAPIATGKCNEGVYMLFERVSGYVPGPQLTGCTKEEQYKIAVRYGEILRKIHSVKLPRRLQRYTGSGGKYFSAKKLFYKLLSLMNPSRRWQLLLLSDIRAKSKSYKSYRFKIPAMEHLYKYIEQNKELLKNTKQVCQHGDFATRNSIFSGSGNTADSPHTDTDTDTVADITIIDFTFGYKQMVTGDPIFELVPVYVSYMTHPAFCLGFIHGYFGRDPQEDEWKRLMLYTAYKLLPGRNENPRNMQKDILALSSFLYFHDDMTSPVPGWYQNPGEPLKTVELLRFKSCAGIAQMWMNFNRQADGRLYLSPCHSAETPMTTAAVTAEGGIPVICKDPKETMDDFIKLKSAILTESIKQNGERQNVIACCGKCPHYHSDEWVFEWNDITHIIYGKNLDETGRNQTDEVIKWAVKNKYISPCIY